MNSAFCQCPTLTELVEFKLNENYVFVQNLMLSWIAVASTYVVMFKAFAHKIFRYTYQIARQYKHEIQKYNLTTVQNLSERARDLTESAKDVYENIPVISYEVQVIVALACLVIFLLFRIRVLYKKLNKARSVEALQNLAKCVCDDDDEDDDDEVVSDSESEAEEDEVDNDEDPEYISDSGSDSEDEEDRLEEERIRKRMYKKKPIKQVAPIKKRAEPEFVLNPQTGRYVKKIVA